MRKPNLTATMMAYTPYRDVERAVQAVVENFPEAPCFPVITRSMRHMLEGVPCLVFDKEKRQVLLDVSSGREPELLEFYEKYEAQDLDHFVTSEKAAPGLYALLSWLKASRPPELKYVAFQTGGPVLLGDVIKQMDGTPAFHNETLRDVLTKAVGMKSRWLEKKIKEELPGVEVIAGLPETTLVGFTSAGGAGTREDILSAIDGGFEGLNCVRWIHCCANIDWTLLTGSSTDVINFDAYQHADRIVLYHEHFKAFLERGGMLAWGIVPVTDELIGKESVASLLARLRKGMAMLVEKGIDEDLLVSSSWIMPCCDTVLMTQENCDRAYRWTREISETLRAEFRLPS